ncbi:MAG: GNAT family N-acetyltransferase [Micavibrio aeruginosavorus]|nr:GNAT family N-acetyltransferase [Micavibrio aeruginosavorus]
MTGLPNVWARKKVAPEKPTLLLRGSRVYLRPGREEDWRAWAELRAASRDHLTPFEPQWAEDSLTERAFRLRLERQQRDWRLGISRSLLIFLEEDDSVIGGINLNNICRGAAQYCSLGYWLGQPYQGHGYMQESARLLIAHAFGPMELHRINAATLPHNGRSIKMLRRLGFIEEGFAKNYIQINGAYQDHILFGLCADSADHALDVEA